MTGTEIKKSCCRLCTYFCPVQVHVNNGEVVKVESDKVGANGRRFICERAALGAVDFHNHPQRLNYPLKRIGAKGEGKWAQISWEQATGEIANKLNSIRANFGPEAVAVMTGHGSEPFSWTIHRWCNIFGTPNTFSSTKNCWAPQLAVELAVCGSDTYPNLPKPGVTRCMVVFGGNPYESRPYWWDQFVEAKKQGAKLIVIDPRRTRTADMADIWLQIKPGSDGALAYAMLNVIIQEKLYDELFVQKWCSGFDKVSDFVKEYSPEAAEAITWIPQEKIVQVARMYALGRPAVLQAIWGVTHSQLGRGRTLCINPAKSILRAITGNLDIDGGELLRSRTTGADYARNMQWKLLLEHPLRKKDTIGADRFPIMSVRAFRLYSETWQKVFGEAGYPLDRAVAPNPSPYYIWNGIAEGKPYPIRALIVSGLNAMCTTTNTRSVYRALTSENLDLHVSIDTFMTPNGMLADYVLPAADWMERSSMNPGDIYGSVGEQAVKPKYERRIDYELWRDLGKLLGQGEYWPEDAEDMYDLFLKSTGFTFKELVHKARWDGDNSHQPEAKLKKYEQTGFATPSGKVELVPSLLEKLDYKVLSHYDEFLLGAEDEYPLKLITGGRLRPFFHSTLRQLSKLRQRHHDPMLQIHPDTAREYQISNGEWVGIETPLGRIKHKAEVTDRIHPKVVHIEHGWWFPEEKPEEPHLFGVWESNAEVILPNDPEVCDYQGGPPMRAVPCRLVKL